MAILYDKKSLLENKNFVLAAEKLYTASPEDMAQRTSDIVTRHRLSFGSAADEVRLFSAPGRIEIAGNHTDHNNGKVLAAAISVDLLGAVSLTAEPKIIVNSIGYPSVSVDLNDLEPKDREKGDSAALVRGIARAFRDRGYNIGGFLATTTSDVFKGAGMSSSASFELFVAEVLNAAYNGGIVSDVEKAVISQYAENVFFGKPSGLMDQSAISIGGVSYIDFKDPAAPVVEKLEWPFDKESIIYVVNCGGDHCNLTANYAEIMQDMKKVANEFGAEKLREIEPGEFYAAMGELKAKYPGRAILRAMHYFEENDRVDELKDAISFDDSAKAFSVINASGLSSQLKLQNCYPEGDFSEPIPLALAIAKDYAGVKAARVHGGGFAGTILVITDIEADEFGEYMSSLYGAENVHRLKIRAEGATEIDLGE